MSTRLKSRITYLSIFLYLFVFSLFFPRLVQAVSPLSNLEQQISISNGEFSTSSLTDSPADNSLGLISFDPSLYNGETVRFEAVFKCVSCTGGNTAVAASLYDDAGNLETTITSTSGTYTRVRSNALTLPADNYTVRFKVDADSGTAYIKAARLIIIQSAGSITDTETQIEVGHYESTTDTSATALSAPKYYQFDASQFSDSPTAYFEATIKNSASLSTVTYYFNGRDGTEIWDTSPDNMVDGNTSNYSSSTTDNDIQLLTTNSAPGTDLGEITKVEVRAYAYQQSDTSGDLVLRPVFGGSSDGNDHSIVLPTSPAWTDYQDITTDSNAPSSWAWSNVQVLDADVVWSQNGGSNTGYVSQVEVRVTYKASYGTTYAELYNRTNSATVATVTIADDDYTLVRSAALSSNWDTSNPDEYEVRIYTSGASFTGYISNAKIIIDQTNVTGITSTELIHHQVTTLRTQTNTTYTRESFNNQFDPSNFVGANSVNYYLEATIKTSLSGTAYASLYNVNGSDVIDDPTSSEITTGSTDLSLIRSSDLRDNTDWPTWAWDLDTILKAGSGDTTTVTSSWLVIQVRNVDPSLSFTIAGVPADETHNGVTTSVTSDTTQIDFGNVAVASTYYAAHELSIDTNDASSAYSVTMKLINPMQGVYPANNIDGFTGSSATWESPQLWSSPDGTTKNIDTGWLGANTSDSEVTGWSGASSKFGPVTTSEITVMTSASGADKTIYVSFAFEVNVLQPADLYTAQLQYNITPVY